MYQLRHEETGKTEVVHEDRMKLTYNSQLSHRHGHDKAGKANDKRQDRYQLRTRKERRRGEEKKNWDDKPGYTDPSSTDDDNDYSDAETEGGRRGEEPARGTDTDPEEGGHGPSSSEGEDEAGDSTTGDQNREQVSTTEEDIMETDSQEGGEVP